MRATKDTVRLRIPYAMLGGSVPTAASRLLTTWKKREWPRALGEHPLDGRVVWTFDEDGVSVYYRPQPPGASSAVLPPSSHPSRTS